VDDRKAFENAIDAALARGEGAGPQRLVYADWLDEQNTPEDAQLAMAQRWMAGRGAHPNHVPSVHFGHRWSWDWWRGRRWPHADDPTAADIPEPVFDALPKGRSAEGPGRRYLEFPTRQEAEQALSDALAHQPG
jgi:uncharacterized protein (TIGR02996 family)